MKRLLAVSVCATILMASVAGAEEEKVATWIGGAKESLRTEANWDDPDSIWATSGSGNEAYIKGTAVFTNSVTFTESGSAYYWKVAKLCIRNNSTVTFGGRLTPYGNTLTLDVEKGSTANPNYIVMRNGSADTFYKTGPGLALMGRIGSSGNLFANAYLTEGETRTGLVVLKNLFSIGENATFVSTLVNIFDSQDTCYLQVDGLWNLSGNAQTIKGLTGTGVITNATAGLTLNLLKQETREFSGRIFGTLTVAPDASASTENYLVVGDAMTLAACNFWITDVEGFENPVRFKPGIGTFYARTADFSRTYYDTDGGVVTLLPYREYLYVDASKAAGTGDGLTPETAFHTIKEAIDVPRADPQKIRVIRLAAGTYDEGTTLVNSVLRRAAVPAYTHVIGADADTTFIVGAPSPTPVSLGCGPDAVACVSLEREARLEKCTVTGGRTGATSDSYDIGGGVTAEANALIVDCVISNNVARRGGGGHAGTYIRTKIVENGATSLASTLYGSFTLYNCVADGSSGDNMPFYSGGGRARIVNSTLGPNGATMRCDGTKDNITDIYNSILMGTTYSESSITAIRVHNSVILGSITSKSVILDVDCEQTTAYTTAAQKLAYLNLGTDLKPVDTVPGFPHGYNVGSNDYWTVPAGEDATTDLAGNARIQNARIDLGAYEYDGNRRVVEITDEAGSLLLTGVSLGQTLVTKEEENFSFTVSRTLTGTRLASGVTVNGETHSFADEPTLTFNMTYGGEQASVVIAPVFAENVQWYADPTRPDDSGDGLSALTAKKTLAAFANLPVYSGDTIHAAPGNYNEGVVTNCGANRVVVPEGVTLLADKGRQVTTITGAGSDGETGIRCVRLCANAKVRGFRLTAGRTWKNGSSYSATYGGGGVSAYNWSAWAIDCEIDHCSTGGRGNGVYGGSYASCYFHDSGSFGIYAASLLMNCLVKEQAYTDSTFVNCTFVGSGNAPKSTQASWSAYAYNCFVESTREKARYFNSYIVNYNSPESHATNETCRIITLDEAKFDANYVPQPGSVLLDAGDDTYYAEKASENSGVKDRDYYLGVRQAGAHIDIGCAEYDENTRYVTINDADGILTLTGIERGVTTIRVGDSRTFTVARNLSASRYALGIQVNGGEMLSLDTPQQFTVAYGDENPMATVITVVYKTDWYVDATKEDDSGDGFSEASAKKTLAAAMAIPYLAAGDTVWAAPGDYQDGLDSVANYTTNRVYVREGVKLVSTGGKDVTFIRGGYAADAGAKAGATVGPGAIRCAYVAKGALLKGFTLYHGATEQASYPGKSCIDGQGGGALASFGYVVDCLIRDCYAVRGGGVTGSTFIRCKVVNCSTASYDGASVAGSHGYTGTYFNCYFGGQIYLNASGATYNCTVYGDLLHGSSSFYNSISTDEPTALAGKYYSCFFEGTKSGTSKCTLDTNSQDGLGAGGLKLNSKKVPRRSSPCLDAGDTTAYENAFPTHEYVQDQKYLDLNGNPRVVGEAIDAGCYERNPKGFLIITR